MKLKRIVVCARLFESKDEHFSILIRVSTFDLDNPSIYRQVKADYDLARDTIKYKGFDALTGRMGVFVQPRTKGPGHGSTSRAFYARKNLVAHILGLPKQTA
jgi:DNA mismatch repair protein MutH